ncbi:MAG: hypothetical protein Fur0046_05280 [Cyanobacteria bacterium J069]|nr:MAG: hypothetical protein D6742_18885 [Cyanobacteria bacterium J069]
MGSQPLTVHLENQPIFAGQVKELSGPYLGFAAALSLGAGITSLAMLSWSQSSRKLSRVEDEMSDLRQQLKDRENELESVRFSETRLSAAGLDSFLDEVESVSPAAELLQHSMAQVEAEQLVPVSLGKQAELSGVAERAKLHTATSLNPVQASVGLAKTASLEETVESVSQALQGADSPAQIEDLLSHLKRVMAQVEGLQAEQLVQQPQPRLSRVPNTVWQQQRLAS